MKKIILSILSFFCAVLMCINVYAANPRVTISGDGYDGYDIQFDNITKHGIAPIVLLFVNGDVVSDADIIIKNGTTLVPLRVIGDRLNADIEWDNATRTAKINKGNIIAEVTIGKPYITVNGAISETNVPTQIINSLTYIPLRVVTTALGAEIGYIDNILGFSNDLKIVYVQDKHETPVITEAKAEEIVKEAYFKNFLISPTVSELIEYGYKVNTKYIDPQNIEEKLHRKYIGKCIFDLGEYYYIKLFDDSGEAALVDKYDGSCFAIDSVSLMLFGISEEGQFNIWGWHYQ